jgi:predicted kinase
MATLFLMCGLPGSGKTTLARRIERDRDALHLRLTQGILS